ncbi:MAG: hypothetical protein MUO24_06575 [Desulfobacterales bacterium]|nr:hypothetical protein [Desulfobacterales bacterium]
MKWKPHIKAMLVFMVIFFVLVGIGGVFSPITLAKDNKEIGPNDVQGKVLSIRTKLLGRGTIEVKSDLTEKVYMFYVGMDTVYNPNRYPAVGETIKVTYFNDQGKLKAARVQIIESLP